MHKPHKIAICLVVLGFLGAKSFAQILSPPTIAVQPVGISVQNQGTAVFTVEANLDILGTPSFTWYYDKTNTISTSSNITIVSASLLGIGSESTLTIKNVNATNAGYYSVKLSNTSGSITSSNVLLVVLPPPVAVPIHIFSPTAGLTAAGFNVQLSTPAGSNVVIEASSDLANWTPIYTNLDSTGSISFTDTTATNYPYRYYRAHTQ